jgi:hypothetical protein
MDDKLESLLKAVVMDSSTTSGVQVVWLPWTAKCNGQKINTLNEKKIDFLHSTNFNILSKIKDSSLNDCDYF